MLWLQLLHKQGSGQSEAASLLLLLTCATAAGDCRASAHSSLSRPETLGSCVPRDFMQQHGGQRSAGQHSDIALTPVAGHLASQTSLGFLYERGLGVAQDFLTAATW